MPLPVRVTARWPLAGPGGLPDGGESDSLRDCFRARLVTGKPEAGRPGGHWRILPAARARAPRPLAVSGASERRSAGCLGDLNHRDRRSRAARTGAGPDSDTSTGSGMQH